MKQFREHKRVNLLSVKNGSRDQQDVQIETLKRTDVPEATVEQLLTDVKGTLNFPRNRKKPIDRNRLYK